MSKHALTFNLVLVAICGLASVTALTACDPGGEPDSVEPRASSIDPVPLPADDAVGSPANPASASGQGSLHDQIMALQPQKTRAGWLRITDPVINTPEAAPILIERLRSGDDAPEVRAALAEAIGRTRGQYAAPVSELLTTESDARVREMLVGTLGRQAPSADAHLGLEAALHDAEPAVRAAAARTLADRKDGAQLADSLVALLQDRDTKVCADTARTLGVLRVDAAKHELVDLLANANPEVRLQALRAIDRIDPGFAGSLAPLATLAEDSDQRVKRLATTIRQR
ncbi:HEAT repeat domain-containing protein [Enhygromyxa salina]|uniref:HEAT repeat protein n=1 Tax=Enhygromyxa salina TaxID=215803 RepID=A0A2S9YKF9_9BACT|nr:HEAT repeat domain-containing protein [Enhygromyxa salina]PRQ05587.1 HEAT repeat protein [Enhygromyxa salina]